MALQCQQDFNANVRAIERIICRAGIALGIDWSNDVVVRALAHEALTQGAATARAASNAPGDITKRVKAELFGMAALMLRTMTVSALCGQELSAGPQWKAFGRALWEENEVLEARVTLSDRD